ncbi:MAG: bifunctional demethylmenaquinone methyltransferase/2-methoxy-6-polyprenyl-1,4-benzoquinol methylase UbiE [Kistimonas sp.]|nr:bifunctional demethylmenaquinone methyltransferase/2-methoxy-6-polyprenyl-1,4-benzoquinol methylase UbiE [Kistimonas sp.]
MHNEDSGPNTHFGFRTVNAGDKDRMVADVFHSVAGRYDLMNDLLSLGIHRLWKRCALQMSAVRPGHKVLDLAGGTGDLALKFAQLVGPEGQVVLADINDSMLRAGRDRLTDKGAIGAVRYVQANAQCLPFADNSFDLITMAFGLRNVTHKSLALLSMLRVLRPGGRLLVLEFSKPRSALLSKLYDTYSFTALPLLGRLVAGDADSYRYLAESIRMHPDQVRLESMMQEAGFVNTSYQNMTGGIVALHKGIKP